MEFLAVLSAVGLNMLCAKPILAGNEQLEKKDVLEKYKYSIKVFGKMRL